MLCKETPNLCVFDMVKITIESLENVDVFVTSECIHLYILCIVPDVYFGKYL